MTDKEALKLELEALEMYELETNSEFQRKAITVIKKALAQPEQEPVAWMHKMDNTEGLKGNETGIVSITQKRKHPFGKPGVDFSKSYPVTSMPLYTTPPQRTWVGLTDEERNTITRHHAYVDNIIKATEAKLKEKNT
jgi:hypothetical protein